MQRVDLSHALGRPLVLNAEHDGRIVADVGAEWARRHGKRFGLEPELLGTEHISTDADEFCRTLAGRVTATGLLTNVVPF